MQVIMTKERSGKFILQQPLPQNFGYQPAVDFKYEIIHHAYTGLVIFFILRHCSFKIQAFEKRNRYIVKHLISS